MPEYAAKFKISNLLSSGLELPEKVEINQDFIIHRHPTKPEVAIALIRFKTEEEEYFDSKAYEEAKKTIMNFVCIHSVFARASAKIEDVGVQGLKEGEPLDATKLNYFTIEGSTIYPDEEKPKVLQREHAALLKSAEIFKVNEKTLKNNSHLVNAIHYFFHADVAERIEEKLIDLIISLEALYLTEKMELGYRLSLRVASLMGPSYKDRAVEQIAEEIRGLYEKRSRVVHGDPEEITLNEIFRLEDYTRKTIKIFIRLSSTKSKREILRLLDDSLFNINIRDAFKM